jgi:hypothetical protein
MHAAHGKPDDHLEMSDAQALGHQAVFGAHLIFVVVAGKRRAHLVGRLGGFSVVDGIGQ